MKLRRTTTQTNIHVEGSEKPENPDIDTEDFVLRQPQNPTKEKSVYFR